MNKKIMSSLHRLPLLEHLYLNFERVPYERLFIGPGFTSLKSISLINIYDGDLKQAEVDVITDDIRCVLASCSNLENIHITTSCYGRFNINFIDMIGDIPGQADFSPSLTTLRLRGISLSLTSPSLRYLARLKSLDIDDNKPSADDVYSVLASCPALESLQVWASNRNRLDIDFMNMVKDIPSQANFSPSLKTLLLRGVYLSLTNSPLQYLANLKSLDFHNIHPSDEKVWDIMTSHRLGLEIIKVAVITSSLVGYLLHYRGVQEFHILQGGIYPALAPRPDNEAKKNLLYSAFPHHQDSLIAFHAQLLHGMGALEIHPEEVAYLEALPSLTTVKISYALPGLDPPLVISCF
ncbi:hypothetical protein EST38_g12900 [Candolleomyces aberdarensis]|uniref:Uncharacterized protein n=1 Tax=Candolleomyces aberdarensis TaxID=2316362 RepID=A0A4Q2D3L4_9AGAR|nr:hypothetical protein EST38_g12900 [Candolleomyces aberdarensis]